MAPVRSTVTVSPLLDSSGRACAFGSEMSTPPCIIGAVIMKMIINSIITSIRLTTLISALSTSRSRPRRRRDISSCPLGRCEALDHALSDHQRDELRSDTLELSFDLVEARSEDVVREYRGNRDTQCRRCRYQRLGNAWSDSTDVAGSLGRNSDERIDHAEHGSEKSYKRTDGSDCCQRCHPLAESVALCRRLGVEDELKRLDLRATETRGS